MYDRQLSVLGFEINSRSNRSQDSRETREMPSFYARHLGTGWLALAWTCIGWCLSELREGLGHCQDAAHGGCGTKPGDGLTMVDQNPPN